ncbi:murein hydrolase activator EnvC family protein [Bordetella genomosp. 9]|uniref:Peptidase n=1 Tax=Bordetella genomosp. 9 TaxID=1416803 RepID=A0A1W6Z4F7_9BORD|nr:peptidoglycan DD-metalloendopeptidase family protein [Bordetella genomosp. 9]ARP88166.1 peptidase [Bordetella genomosp. 9]
MRVAAGMVGAAALMLAVAVARAAPGDLSEKQSEAQRQQSALRERIQSLQKTIEERESARKEAADALRESETAISQINRRLAELAAQSRQAEADLAALERQMTAQQAVLAQRREELARQLRSQYASGLSPWTALLSGDDPQALGRNLAYLGYVSQARAQAVQVLRRDLEELARLQGRADARRQEIADVVKETGEQKNALVAQQKERASVLARLEGQIEAQRQEAVKLGRDDARMSRLIEDLQAAIEKQAEEARKAEEARRKAEEARRKAEEEAARKAEQARRQAIEEARRKAEEARKRAEEARKAAEASRRAQEAREATQARGQVEAAARRDAEAAAAAARQAAEAEAAARRAAEASLPVARGNIEGLTPVEPAGAPGPDASSPVTSARSSGSPGSARPSATASAAPSRPLPEGRGLRPGLAMPVKGATIQGRFGVSRPDGGVWRGIVLRVPEGTPVHAVAPGTVVYANWLRGFGNLIIVDHGQQYMTVYGYNQALMKQVGDRVGAGDTIATAGATGGQVESGLYFEIRHGGAPVDPAQWLAQ